MTKYAIALTTLIFLLKWTSPVMAKDTIYWQTYHRPPGIIQVGEHKNQGFIDKVLALIIKNMPEYKHAMPTASLARAIADIKAGKQVCHPALHADDTRKQYMYFSQPAMMNPMNRLIGEKHKLANLLSQPTGITKASLVDYTFALIKDRTYDGGYDQFVQSDINHEKLIYISSETLDTLFHLVALKRVDFTIGYPFELEHFLSKNPALRDEIGSYKLPGTPAFSVGYVACPKTAWGKETIEKINLVLSDIKSTDAYRQAMTSWWEEEASTEAFTHYYQSVFLSSSRP